MIVVVDDSALNLAVRLGVVDKKVKKLDRFAQSPVLSPPSPFPHTVHMLTADRTQARLHSAAAS